MKERIKHVSKKQFTKDQINELEQIFIMQYQEDEKTAKETVKRLSVESPEFLKVLLRINAEKAVRIFILSWFLKVHIG